MRRQWRAEVSLYDNDQDDLTDRFGTPNSQSYAWFDVMSSSGYGKNICL